MAPRSKGEGYWATLLSGMKNELRGTGSAVTQRRRGASEFAEWADKEQVPEAAKWEEEDASEKAILVQFEATLDVHKKGNGALSKQGEACLTMAKELLAKSRGVKTDAKWEDVVATIAKKAKAAPSKTEAPTPTAAPAEEPMAKRPLNDEPEQFEEEGPEGEEEETEQEFDGPEEEEEAPPQRRQRPPPVRVQFVERPAARGHNRAQAAPRSTAMKNILPRPEKVRLYKRNEMGKRELIDDYSVDEIGDMKLEQFIREYVDPQFSNEGVESTEYIAYELEARTGKEKMPPATINVRTGPAQPEAPNPMNQFRQAMGMVQELQQATMGMQPQQTPKDPMLAEAQRKAAAGGDMQGMFMLMMMERMQQQQQAPSANSDLLMKVLDRLERMERGGARDRTINSDAFGPPMGMGPSMGMGPPGYPPFPFAPPPMHQPEPQSNKLLDLAMSRLAEKPPSLADSVKDLMALQMLMQPKQNDTGEVAALRAEIRQLSGGPKGGLEESLGNFEKLVQMSKAVSTQVNGGSDVGGFFKGLITPEVGKVIAGIVAQAQTGAAAPAAPVQAAPVPVPVRDFNRPPSPIPADVINAVKQFQLAQTPEVQAQRFVDVVMSMWLTNDPYYQKMLSPALEELNKSEESVERLRIPRKLSTQLLLELRPQLARPEFVDACLAAMALRAGAQLPNTLLSTHGKWSYNGTDVIMLEQSGARAVTEDVVPIPLTQPLHPTVAAGNVAPAVLSPPREEVVKPPEAAPVPVVEVLKAEVLKASEQVIEASPTPEFVTVVPEQQPEARG